METADFTFTLWVDKSPEKVFQAITKVRSWWAGFHSEEINGSTEELHDRFSFFAGHGAHYTEHKLVEMVPNEKIVWLTTHSSFSFVENPNEWTNTEVIFEISEKGNQTQLVFTHKGLTPKLECYDTCSASWVQYLTDKLLPLINSEEPEIAIK